MTADIEYDSHDYQDDYQDDYQVIKNMPTSDLTVQAQTILSTITDKIIFQYEEYIWGNCDKYGPTEHTWTFYVVVEQQDQTIKYLKFDREVFEMHGDQDKNIYYESSIMHDYDYKKLKNFV